MRSLLFHFPRIPLPSPSSFFPIRLCNLCSSMGSSASDFNSTSLLVLGGKSLAENEIAKTIKTNDTLKLPDSSEISIVLLSELDDKSLKDDSFGVDLFMNSLSTSRFGRFLIWSPRLSSTHDVISHPVHYMEPEGASRITQSSVKRVASPHFTYIIYIDMDDDDHFKVFFYSNFSELPLGAVCVADVQTKGRGRSKNVWESPLGCLLFSFTLQMEDGRVVPLVQYVVSLAMTEAIKDICDKNGLPSVDVKIKWPNDLYLNGLKVGGILCTSTYKSKKFNISAGIGLNVNNEKPTTCLDTALRELSMKAYQFQREDILAAFFNKFENFYDLFVNQGFQTLEQLYYKTWLHSEQRVIVQEKDEDKVIEHAVTIQGLTSSGFLLAVGDDNQMCELHPDGNSFDFFKGLVRRKLE